MRVAKLAILAALIASPALAQPYGPPPYGGPPGYGGPYGGPPPGGPPPSIVAFHEARRAEETAHERAAVGDFGGAARAHAFAERRRYEAERLRQEGR